MAKKYLLYIHDERFDKEKKKSELINVLLNDWYGRILNLENPIKAPIVLPEVIKSPKDVKMAVKKIKNDYDGTGFIPKSFSARKKK